ncbi:uncharacterized protein LOC134647415 [Cydia amplana]|uniref:uncharacterized protein LOC134647415 n=1 Tax=Cydia amplana TaxID=1869771 RepID=UPI002FE672D0
MGQAGSQQHAPLRAHRAHTLPHEPLRHAPKVLPSLTESPRLRSTDNGAILHSGGTISGRRPTSVVPETTRTSHGHVHSNAYRSRSAGATSDSELRARERDPLHRSYTNLDLRHNENGGLNKRFGSEPDLREEEPKQKCKRHFRKKYRAPPPPTNDQREGSSPDSSEGNARPEPQRKLRLFRTRHETKKLSNEPEVARNSYTAYKSLDDQSFERRYRSPYKDKEQHFKYPDTQDMIQSTASLKREEHLLQKQDYRKRTDRVSGCRAKTSKTNDSEAWKTPLLNRNFRHSERFKKVDTEQPVLRREKTFDTLILSERDSESPRTTHESRMKAIGEQLKGSRLQPSEPLRKSLPSLLPKNSEEKDEFQAELKKATSRIRNELGAKINVSENKTSQNKTTQKPNPTKTPSKVKESSLKTNISKPETKAVVSRRPLTRVTESKIKPTVTQSKVNGKTNVITNGDKMSKDKGRAIPDRGQASGKESTPEHSPTRKISPIRKISPARNKTHTPAPSKQFYFGMIESKQFEVQDHLKDFPGLGSPIIEEISNFHAIEQKLLGYHAEDAEFEEFNAKLKEDCKVKNLSSESALSSDASDSDGSLGIALRLRPTLPKKQRAVPRFSPAAAWRQLATLDAHLASETQPLAVETKVSADITAESSPRSDQSADKSGDSGISGDHAHSDQRIESPSRHVPETTPAWTPQQDLGDSSSDGVSGAPAPRGSGLATYSPGAQPFSLSLPRDDKGKQLQQGFNSLQKLRKSVSGALGAALGSRRFDLEHEPMLQEPEQNWFLTKSAPNSLSNPLLMQPPARAKVAEDDIKEENSTPPSEKVSYHRLLILYVHSGAIGAALGSRRFDLEHEPMLQEPEQNWFLTKSAPNSLSNPLLLQPPARAKVAEDDIKEENSTPPSEKVSYHRLLILYVHSGAIGAALGSRRFDLEHEPMLQEPEQNWFLTKSAPNSLSNPLLLQPPARAKVAEDDIKEENSTPPSEKEESIPWRPGINYLSWGGHVMYLPPAPSAPAQPLSMLGPIDRPVRSKSSGSLEVAARAARAAALASEMRERERSASPEIARALPARVQPQPERNARSRNKRFTFQSTVRQLERRRLAEKLSKEADLKEQQRRTELEAMRRVEEEFQRKRAREKANIRQQLRLVSSGAASMPLSTHHGKARDDPDGSCRASPAPERPRDRQRNSNTSSEISARSKSTTPVRCVELSEWRTDSAARVYRDWGGSGVGLPAHAHPPACARMPIARQAQEVEAFSGSPRSDNYRLEFARGRSPRSPRTPRPPRLVSTRSPSSSGSELSLRQPIKISDTKEEEEPAIVPTLRPGPARATFAIR